MKRSLILAIIVLVSLSACDGYLPTVAAKPPSPQITIIPITGLATATASVTPFMPVTATFTPTPTVTPTPTETPLPTATDTPTPEPTATWAYHGPEQITAPILLYHHIGKDGENNNRYFVAPDVFEKQMQVLRDKGYTAITIRTLVNTLIYGGDMPERPVVITFDDGNEDIYTTAFPIMQRYGFVGTFYIVANRVGASTFVNADQLKEMVAAGWEIGSHSYSHIDLTINHDTIWHEMANSRIQLEQKLGVTIKSFAYPFGKTDPTVTQKVQDYGYNNAVGLGIYVEHSWGSLYYLSREEVRASYDMDAFAALLPWN